MIKSCQNITKPIISFKSAQQPKALELRGGFVDSGVKSALQLINETMCFDKSGVEAWAAEVCHNGGGSPFTETDAVQILF